MPTPAEHQAQRAILQRLRGWRYRYIGGILTAEWLYRDRELAGLADDIYDAAKGGIETVVTMPLHNLATRKTYSDHCFFRVLLGAGDAEQAMRLNQRALQAIDINIATGTVPVHLPLAA